MYWIFHELTWKFQWFYFHSLNVNESEHFCFFPATKWRLLRAHRFYLRLLWICVYSLWGALAAATPGDCVVSPDSLRLYSAPSEGAMGDGSPTPPTAPDNHKHATRKYNVNCINWGLYTYHSRVFVQEPEPSHYDPWYQLGIQLGPSQQIPWLPSANEGVIVCPQGTSPEMATEAAGRHPTGMHSRLILPLWISARIYN